MAKKSKGKVEETVETPEEVEQVEETVGTPDVESVTLKKSHTHKGTKYEVGTKIDTIKDLRTSEIIFMKNQGVI